MHYVQCLSECLIKISRDVRSRVRCSGLVGLLTESLLKMNGLTCYSSLPVSLKMRLPRPLKAYYPYFPLLKLMRKKYDFSFENPFFSKSCLCYELET